MGKRITTDIFIKMSKKIHGNIFNYSKTIYSKYSEKLIIICKKHNNEFKQSPNNHLHGQNGCRECFHEKCLQNGVKHGLRNHVLYKKWNNMISRCYNPKHPSFNDYGGRGIKVSEEFKDCKIFIEYLQTLDNCDPKLEVDRINNEGDYERGNIKFSTKIENSLNKRIPKRNTSGYEGVGKHENKWRAYLTYNKKVIHIGRADSLEKALELRNNYIILNKLPHKIQTFKNA